LVVFTAQGLRNQSGPRWLAIGGILALILVVEGKSWQGGYCDSPTSLISSSIWFASVALLLLHHAVQPRRENGAWPQRSRMLRLACQGVLLLFVSLLGAWFAFYQLMVMMAGSNPHLVETLISTVERNISLPAYVLLPFAAAITVYQIVTRSKIANER
jgi:predicted small integral membrane protein